MTLPEIFVISLAHRSDRIHRFCNDWENIGFTISVVPAIYYTKTLPEIQKSKTIKEAAQYATFLSHMRAVRFFIQSEKPIGWIAEDDAFPLQALFTMSSSDLSTVLTVNGLINLGPNIRSCRAIPTTLRLVNKCCDEEIANPPFCMHLYQITRDFALQYYTHLKQLVRTKPNLIYDVDIYSNRQLIEHMYYLSRPLAGQRPGQSDIEMRPVQYNII